MAKSKIYAVYDNGKIEFFNAWADCLKRIHKQSNILYKGFSNQKLANDWVFKLESSKLAPSDSIKIYVDGSFNPQYKYAGWGWIAIHNQKAIAENHGITNKPALSRNIDGEIEATIQASQWASKQYPSFIIVHDYIGLAHWFLGTWKIQSEIAHYYVDKMQDYKGKVFFEKVVAHSGNKWNNRADELAKKSIFQQF